MSTQNQTFQLISHGEILPGFELADVQRGFAQLFNISEDKASAYVKQYKVLKQELEHSKAYSFKTKLEDIGLKVELKANQTAKPSFELSLEPTAEEQATQANTSDTATPSFASSLSLAPSHNETAEQNQAETQTNKQTQAKAAAGMLTCPKCHTEQKHSKQCVQCGVYFHKVLATQEQPEDETEEYLQQDDDGFEAENEFDMTAFIVAAVVAVIGAFVWKFIAAQWGIEIGWVAWGIGGAIGYAAAFMDWSGQKAGLACAVLAAVAIFGGKYMAVDAIYGEWLGMYEEFSLDGELGSALLAQYQDEVITAQYYVDSVHSDAELRNFMISQGYTEAILPEMISKEEIEDFKLYDDPYLRDLVNEANGGELNDLEQSMRELNSMTSTWGLMKEELSWIDIIFFLLGTTTAFGLANRGLRQF